jgi:hypothetical protein
MSGRSILAALLGAVVLFVWGFVFWTILPWSMQTIRPLPNHAAIASAVTEIPTGTYFYPDISHTGLPTDDPRTDSTWNEMFKRGPLFEVRVQHEGMDMMSPMMFVWGFLHFFASTLIAVILLRTVRPQLAGIRGQVLFLTMVGLLIAVFADLSGPIWFHYPWDRALTDAVYTVIAWLLAGLAIALVLRRPREVDA